MHQAEEIHNSKVQYSVVISQDIYIYIEMSVYNSQQWY